MLRISSYQKWFSKRYTSCMLGVLLLSISSGLQGTTQTIQIPSLAEAARRADQMSPKDLTQIEVDESIRDRLRFDPEWQPILQGVRRDMIALKWGNGKLVNPAWEQYGPKVYPLLDYYTRSGDRTREAYGMLGLRALGKPYTTLWLERQLQRHVARSSFSLVTPDLKTDCSSDDCWKNVFGLDDSGTRARLINIARQSLESKISPNYEDQFNVAFLEAILGRESGEIWQNNSSEFNPETAPGLQKWLQMEKLSSPSENQVQAAVTLYRTLPSEAQKYILVDYLDGVKAGDISPIGKAVLRSLAMDTSSSDRMWAIAELNRHGDSQGTTSIKEIVNGNLEQLYDLTESTSVTLGKYPAGHVALLLIALSKEYPQSKFIRGCVEYGDLRGTSYFGQEPRSKAIRSKNASKVPAEWAKDWQQWLKRYPDHPGADDATYLLGRSLQDEDDILGAMRQFTRMMTQRPGDGDALELAWPHVRTYLDVGLSVEQLKVITQEQRDSTIEPLLQYALAVRQARLQNYAESLSLTEGLDLTKMPPYVLGTYYYRYHLPKPEVIQKEMQVMLAEQRQRWQNLRTWQAEDTPASLYRIASSWEGLGGWRNGYLPIWENNRTEGLPILEVSSCKRFWVCNFTKREPAMVRATYQSSNGNAVALSLYQKILSNPRTPPDLREKTLFMIASILFTQWEFYPDRDTVSIHPLPGMSGETQIKNIWQAEIALDIAKEKLYRAWQAKPSGEGLEGAERQASKEYDQAQEIFSKTESKFMAAIKKDYQSQIDKVISQLQADFPQSVYIDDLLFSNYFFSGQRQYLEKIVRLYPNGDRIAEAKFLLEQSKYASPKTHE